MSTYAWFFIHQNPRRLAAVREKSNVTIFAFGPLWVRALTFTIRRYTTSSNGTMPSYLVCADSGSGQMAMGPLTKVDVDTPRQSLKSALHMRILVPTAAQAFRILDEWLTGLVRSQQKELYLLLGRRMLKAARFFISFFRRTTPVDLKTTPEKTLGSEWSEILGTQLLNLTLTQIPILITLDVYCFVRALPTFIHQATQQ